MREAERGSAADDAPSATALRVAALRALHQSLDEPPVFVDPLAVRILGPDAGPLLADYRASAGETAPLRATLAARGVFAAAAVADAVRRGVRQCVLLGAGLDTLAHRHGHPGLRVVEVDRPDAQAWKRACLRRAAIEPPPTLAYVAHDLGGGGLVGALAGAGFDPVRPAVAVMLGVSFYLPAAALLALFGEIGSGCAPGSQFVFDYSEPLHHAPVAARRRYEAAAARVAASGEPWLTFFAPGALREALRARNLLVRADLDAGSQNARWFADRTDGLSVVPLAHLVRAEVGEP